MPSYIYKASTMEGKMVEGTMEASDDGTVSLKLQEMGLIPVRIGASSKSSILTKEIDAPWPWKKKKIRRKDLLIFTQELHTLVKSGFPLDRSLAILCQLTERESMAEVVQDVLKEVKGGKSFSEALAKYPAVFPKVYISMIKAGEAGGALEEILQRLGSFLTATQELRSYIINALIYPALLAIVGVVSMAIITLFVIPNFISVFKNMNVPLPLTMTILNWISTIVRSYWWALAAVVIIGAVIFKNFIRDPEGRLKFDTFKLRVPLAGVVLRKVEVARFARSLGTLLHGGVPLLQSMTIVRDIIANQSIAKTMDPIRNGIKKGEGISQPMKQSGVFPPLAMHLIEVGEESGKLDSMLLQVAEIYDGEVRNGIKNLISFFEPALIVVMGVVIGGMVVSMLMAIFSIYDMPF